MNTIKKTIKIINTPRPINNLLCFFRRAPKAMGLTCGFEISKGLSSESLFDLKALKKQMTEEEQRKDFIKLHKRKKNEPKTKHNKTLEK